MVQLNKSTCSLTIPTGEKLHFTPFSIRMGAWLLFHIITESIKLNTFHYHILKNTDV